MCKEDDLEECLSEINEDLKTFCVKNFIFFRSVLDLISRDEKNRKKIIELENKIIELEKKLGENL